MLCNPQGEVLQIANVKEVQFLAEALQREARRELSHSFLQEHLRGNTRASLVELVRAALLVNLDDGKFDIAPEVKSMACGIIKAARAALQEAQVAVDLPPIPLANRLPANPVKTGVMMNLTQGAQQLRHIPVFIGAKSTKVQGGCGKPGDISNKHKRGMHWTQNVLNLVCLKSQQSVGLWIMDDYEGRSHGVLALYCFSPYFPRTVVCDTGCQSASWAFAHLKRFFHRWRFIVDQFHHYPHKCQAITKPSEFSVMRGVNDSFVEQLHAIQRALALTMQSTSRPRAMFLLQLLQYEIFCGHADRASVPEHKRTWPDPATVPLDPVEAKWDVHVDVLGLQRRER
jgi:hypothetical protein